MRKITQFLGHKTDFGCSKCMYSAEREPGTIGASGKMSYYTTHSRCEERTHMDIVHEYLLATSKSAAASVANKYGVEYSRAIEVALFLTLSAWQLLTLCTRSS